MKAFEKRFRRAANAVHHRNDPAPIKPVGVDPASISSVASSASDKVDGLIYKPLSSESYEIRILTLLGESKHESYAQIIECKMEHATLLDPGEYTALSYCWGDARNQVPIFINGAKVEITANLGAAIRQLWLHNHHRVWIDALCINQQDREERSLQVRNMRVVYSKAREIVSWVGHAEVDDAEGTKIILQNQSSTLRDPKLQLEIKAERRLQKFFDQPYWKRVWIIQEVAVASNVTLLYGGTDIGWENLANTLEIWRTYPTAMPANIGNFSYAMQLLDFRNKISVVHRPISLIEAMQWSHKSLATDPRDMVFALIGVSIDGPALVPLPNYKQELRDILQDLNIALMDADRSLDLMCIKDSFPVIGSDKPSWMLDLLEIWSKPMPFLSHTILNQRRRYSTKPPIDRLKSGILRVKGRFFDKINSISSAVTKPPIPEEIRDPSAAPNPLLYGSEIGIFDAVWKSLTLGAIPSREFSGDNKALEVYRACFAYLWTAKGRANLRSNRKLAKWLDQNASFKIGEYTLGEMPRSEDKSSTMSIAFWQIIEQLKRPFTANDLQQFIESMRRVVEGSMRLAMTTNGYIGMVHPATRVDDEICCILGCSVPVILRKAVLRPDKTHTYYVIGASYVHGLPDTLPDLDSLSWEGIEIRAPNQKADMFRGYVDVLLC